jgi:hypothetical protein
MITRRLDESFDMTFGHGLTDFLTETDAIGQNIKTRLLLILPEWFLDITEGTPWRSILGVRFDRNYSEAALRQRILETDGVTEITAFWLTADSSTRKAILSVTVKTIYSTLVSVQVGV